MGSRLWRRRSALTPTIEPDNPACWCRLGTYRAERSSRPRHWRSALRERLRTAARQRFLERFDVRSYATRLARLHAGLLGGRRPLGGIKTEPPS